MGRYSAPEGKGNKKKSEKAKSSRSLSLNKDRKGARARQALEEDDYTDSGAGSFLEHDACAVG